MPAFFTCGYVVHLRLRFEFGENAFLGAAPVMEAQRIFGENWLVGHSHLEVMTVFIGNEQVQQLQAKIGQLTMENDFLERGLKDEGWLVNRKRIQRLTRGFVYLVAIMDWHSRRVLSWRISNTLDTSFCIEALEEAIEEHGVPEIFNADQGSQFTSEEFTGGYWRAHTPSEPTVSCRPAPSFP